MDIAQRTVYVVQEPAPARRATQGTRPSLDLTDAGRYGALRYCLEWSETAGLSPAEVVARVRRALAGYGPADYLLMIGNPTAMAAAALVAALRGGGVVRMLVWDRDLRRYEMVPVDVRREIADAATAQERESA